MAMRDLMPRGRGGGSGRGLRGSSDMQNSMLNLRREIESLFDDMFPGGLSPFSGSALGRMGGEQRAMTWPSIEITENENEICINAEVPGLSEDDVELTLDEGVLTIRGEKKTETEDQDRGYSERYYGQFERRIALPQGVDEENAQADFNNGVLKITLRKTPQAERARRIPIGGMRAQGQPQTRGQPQTQGEAMQQAAASPQGRSQRQQGQQQQQRQQQQRQQQQRGEGGGGYEPPTQPQE